MSDDTGGLAPQPAETTLQQDLFLFESLVETSPDFIVVGDRDYRIRYVNKLPPGATLETIIGTDILSFIQPDFRAAAKASMDAVFEGAAFAVYETDAHYPDGTPVWHETRVTPIHQDGQVLYLSLVAQDITRRKAAEQERERLIKELQAAKRIAEENSRLKSEFLATMSHELRTPLNAIEGFTSIMLKGMGGASYNDKTERYLTKVHANSRRLLSLINDFLDLSRIEAGRMELAHMPLSPQALAKVWQEQVSVLAENKGIGFEVSIDPNLPETLYGDEESLSKITLNLLSNAFKFTEQGSVKLALRQEGQQWIIEVTDTGIGIPPHAREYIFDEFRQVDQSSKRRYGGTGLGLTIVQKLVRTMGGTITLSSELGTGSTFTVSLPFQEAAAGPSPRQHPKPSA